MNKTLDMISFGIMTAILVAMACVVHYDLLGLFLPHPYDWPPHDERHQPNNRSRSEFDNHIWIPRPGTDPSTFYLLPRSVFVHDQGSDGEDYWTDSDDHDDGGKHFDHVGGALREPAPVSVDRVPTTTTTEVPDDREEEEDDEDEDDDNYVAPGQEWDDSVF